MSSSSSVEYSSSESSGEANWLPGWGKRIRFETDSSKVDASLSNFPPPNFWILAVRIVQIFLSVVVSI